MSAGMLYIYLDKKLHIYLVVLFPNIGVTNFADWVLLAYI